MSSIDTPEYKSRQKIDGLLTASGWQVQNYKDANLAGAGVVLREFPTKNGAADYALFVERKACGILEAKPEGTTLSGVAEQSSSYLTELPPSIPKVRDPLPFAYESNGDQVSFRDIRDPDSKSRSVFCFHRPETLLEWSSQPNTLRARLRAMPPLIEVGLRDCQKKAIKSLEQSLAENRPRALIQMASGSGKTFTAVTASYRLIKFAKARRILFLVDRASLGKQTEQEFQKYVTPDDGRKFTELYNVQRMTTNKIDPVSNVCITTIQRLYSMLKGEEQFQSELEETSLFEPSLGKALLEATPKNVEYNPKIPIETFDFIITDECHRSIYNLWKQVLEYFDAFLIGLTATPSKQTLGFFNQNLVMEYGQTQAIVDKVNVGYEVYRIKTEISQGGSKIDSGFWIDKRDKLTRKARSERLDEALDYAPSELDRSVVAKDQIRTIIKTFKEKLFTEIFPGRQEVPKTLIFAKDDSHAEDIVEIVREEFGKGNDFCKKITYKTFLSGGETLDGLIKSFCNSYNPRIAVTVDMISTGTDIRPLECLLFMRDVKSQIFFEQMKGRGSRTISDDDFQAITPDSKRKTHYIIVDAVGVCESDKTESRPLEKEKSIPFDKLLHSIALGNRDEDAISSLAYRLSILEKELTQKDKEEIKTLTGGQSIQTLVSTLLNSIDEDERVKKASLMFSTNDPTEEQVEKAGSVLVDDACKAFDSSKLRNTLVEMRRRNEQTIDTISKDNTIFAGFDEGAKQTEAKRVITNFKKFIEDNKDELTALQIIYGTPHAKKELTFKAIKEIADKIEKPPYEVTPDLLWKAYEKLEKSKVRGAPAEKLLTNLISLLRFAVGEYEILEPFAETVDHRFKEWIATQKAVGRQFNAEQMEWLNMIKDHIAASLSIGIEDFDLSPFYEKGGTIAFERVFPNNSKEVLEEFTKALVKPILM